MCSGLWDLSLPVPLHFGIQMLNCICLHLCFAVLRVGNFILPPFHNVRLSSIAYIHLYVNESRHMYVFRFINIYMYVGNARKSYIMKRREYPIRVK